MVDDASTDDSLKIIRQCQKNIPFRLIQNKRNIGCAESCNIAVEKARHKFLCFLAADDFFSPQAPYHLDKMVKTHPNCKIFLWNSQQVFLGGLFVKNKAIYSKDHRVFFDRFNSSADFFKKNRGIPLVGTGLFAKVSYRKAGGFDHGFGSFADYFFCLKMIYQGGFYLNTAPISNFTQTPQNIKSKKQIIRAQTSALQYLLKILAQKENYGFKKFLIRSGAILVFDQILLRDNIRNLKELRVFYTPKVMKILFFKKIRNFFRNPVPSFLKELFRGKALTYQ